MSHTYASLLTHIVFSTKERLPLITSEIKAELFAYLGGLIKELKGKPIIINGMSDHVHILASLPPTISTAEAMRFVKANSSKWITQKFGKPFEWQKGYGAFSVSRSNVDVIYKYIQNQEAHHQKFDFKSEFIGFFYFPEQAEMFRRVIAENQEINQLENLLLESAENKNTDVSETVTDTPKRNIAFRRAIIRLYNYTCAACRLRIITLDGETAVEAAHIFPFAKSYDDSIGNGLSLCPLHHWSFDKGLFSIDDDYKMLVSGNFEESGNEAFLLRSLQAKEIYLPKEKPFRPSLTMIRWHRENQFMTEL